MRLLTSVQFFLATAILGVAFESTCLGQGNLLLHDTSVRHRLDTSVAVYIDSTNLLSFEQISSREFQAEFKPNTGNLTFGYLKSNLWLKVAVGTTSPEKRWYLEIPAPYLEYLDFYQRDSAGRWHQSVSGYYRKQSAREFSHTGHVIPLQLNADSESLVYIRISGSSPKTFPIYAIEESKFIEKTRLEDLGYGIFFGILAVMFFYNFFIYITLKQQNYLYYCCTIVCTFLIFAAISGYGGKFIWPETPGVNYYMGKLSLEVLIVFLSVFTIRFLEAKHYSKPAYYMLLSLLPLSALAFLLVASGIFSFAGNTLVLLSTVVFMAAGVVIRIRGNKMAAYFIAAWSIYFAGGLLITLRNSGVFDYNFWTTHFVEVGAVLETTIIGFALGHQYRRFKREKEEAQRLALRFQLAATSRLEDEVHKRTEELYKANEDLQRTLETNKLQTLIIENKNAELDTFFLRISHDLKAPITSSLGLTVLAKLDVNDPKALTYFDKQHVQLERLSNIVRGLVKLTKLNDDEMQAEMIDFHKLIDECIMSLHWLANFPRISFKKDIQPGIRFYSEWTLLNAILQNLIENSVKYAGEEAPYVKVVVRESSGWVVIEVADNGQGIAEEEQARIFDIFYRATKSEGGSGLGLYILKRSVDRLKGTIDIHSEVGSGSTFTVRLPSLKEIQLAVSSEIS